MDKIIHSGHHEILWKNETLHINEQGFQVSFVLSAVLFQANHTAVLVHKLMSKTRDPEIRDEVRSFALYVHCWKRYRDSVISYWG
jgi:hypothetical protein